MTTTLSAPTLVRALGWMRAHRRIALPLAAVLLYAVAARLQLFEAFVAWNQGQDHWHLHELLLVALPLTAGLALVAEQRRRALARMLEEHARVDQALGEANQTLRSLIEASPIAIIVIGLDDTVRSWNAAAERLFGWRAEEVLGKRNPVVPEARAAEYERLRAATLTSSRLTDVETRRRRRDGTEIDVRISTAVLRDAAGTPTAVLALMADITQHKHLEEQLRLSQRLEAVGRLAGGVAHDFNNLLTAMRGWSESLLEQLPEGTPGHADALAICKGADRATALTGQLLAFSRRQMLQPKVLDLNAVVTETASMLRRLVGPDVRFLTQLEPALGRVLADPGQVEQVLVNLVVNARDAMPDGGALSLETANVDIDEGYAARHAPVHVPTGRYAMLVVSDTGEGMDEETRLHLFEPFYTTKPVGKGTGLGLATVYGIIKQSGGFIWVYSEPGQGTTFKIYLPQVEAGADPAPRAAPAQPPVGGRETVLLVEDEALVRALACKVLRKQGYDVLEARDGLDALDILAGRAGPVHLLLTDIVMPEMSGRALAEHVLAARPDVRVLYMSGYTDRDIVHRGMIDPGTAFLQKPFTADTLARKVREVLDTAAV